jgi:NAD(P)-dependent dehydrogenase (short-subunit alcohol dehydrogenase family)
MNINKTILITGASKNLGAYLTKYYLNKNYCVLGVSKSSKSLINKNSYVCDLSNAKKTYSLFQKLKKKYKKIDAIISCAGNSKKSYKVSETIKDWNFAFDNNFYCFTNVLESYSAIYKNKSTKIIVISSIASAKITKAPITYSVAKSALNFYAKIKSKELAKFDITINTLLPGNILMKGNNWSKKIKKDSKKVKRYIKENVPLNKFCDPYQISLICDYLLSKAGDNITGSHFTIDGGESL